MSETEPPGSDTKTNAGTAYGLVPKAGWELSPNRFKRGMTYVGLYNMRDLTIALVSAVLAVITTLGLQAVFGNDEPSGTQVNYGDIDPDSEIEPGFTICEDLDNSSHDPFCNLQWGPAPSMVNVYVTPAVYKTLPADMKTDPFCKIDAFGDKCDFNEHVNVLKKLLDQRQLDYLLDELDVSPESDDWMFIETIDPSKMIANPGDITGSQFNGGPFPELVEIYLLK